MRIFATSLFLVVALSVSHADEPAATPDATGNHYLTESDFAIDGLPQQRYGLKAGYDRGRLHRINHAGSVGYVVEPTGTVDSKRRWVWVVPLWLALQSDYGNQLARYYVDELLQRGFHVVGFDVGASLGSPKGAALFATFHEHIVREYKLAAKARMLAVSNGGLITYGYAFRYPQRIDRIFGVYPAVDFTSWPGVHRVVGPQALTPKGLAFDLSPSEMTRQVTEFNPIDNLKPLAFAGIPILHLHGDADQLVPLNPNSVVTAERYRAMAGQIKVRVLPKLGHGGIRQPLIQVFGYEQV